ncbi:glycosyltransferase [Mobilicoccus massiliensis]|uniref:glycosyltransferase n=1 Tax=Mobilicoccus massiliensis TaxID=1522310 RepID=UPI00058AECDC|nr:glycosyltransferase [Mobilicoccus massiliensis]
MSSDAPHMLYVAWGFPPSRGGGVYRALATVNAFAREGFRVTVITADRETFELYTGVDESLEAQVDPGVRVVRVPFDWPAMDTDLRHWSALRMWAGPLWRRWRIRKDRVSFPEIGYGPWRPRIEEAAKRIHAEDPIDLTVATANPNVDFCAAAVLNAEYGVPYVMDYRDAWMLDVFDGGLLHPEDSRVDRIEKSLLAGASEVWFVNNPIREWHVLRHPAVAPRMHVVANGHDPDFAPTPRLTPSEGPLTFGYIGTASPKVPLEQFTEAWRLAKESGGDMTDARAQLWGYLGFYTAPSPSLSKLVQEQEPYGLTYEGPVPKARVRETYDSFDVCLLILGSGLYVTSGKVFEYAASALPIVSVHDPRNAATDILSEYPLWYGVTDLEPETIASALVAAAHGARTADEDTRRACAEFARRYSRDLQMTPRVKALKQMVQQRKVLP